MRGAGIEEWNVLKKNHSKEMIGGKMQEEYNKFLFVGTHIFSMW